MRVVKDVPHSKREVTVQDIRGAGDTYARPLFNDASARLVSIQDAFNKWQPQLIAKADKAEEDRQKDEELIGVALFDKFGIHGRGFDETEQKAIESGDFGPFKKFTQNMRNGMVRAQMLSFSNGIKEQMETAYNTARIDGVPVADVADPQAFSKWFDETHRTLFNQATGGRFDPRLYDIIADQKAQLFNNLRQKYAIDKASSIIDNLKSSHAQAFGGIVKTFDQNNRFNSDPEGTARYLSTQVDAMTNSMVQSGMNRHDAEDSVAGILLSHLADVEADGMDVIADAASKTDLWKDPDIKSKILDAKRQYEYQHTFSITNEAHFAEFRKDEARKNFIQNVVDQHGGIARVPWGSLLRSSVVQQDPELWRTVRGFNNMVQADFEVRAARSGAQAQKFSISPLVDPRYNAEMTDIMQNPPAARPELIASFMQEHGWSPSERDHKLLANLYAYPTLKPGQQFSLFSTTDDVIGAFSDRVIPVAEKVFGTSGLGDMKPAERTAYLKPLLVEVATSLLPNMPGIDLTNRADIDRLLITAVGEVESNPGILRSASQGTLGKALKNISQNVPLTDILGQNVSDIDQPFCDAFIGTFRQNHGLAPAEWATPTASQLNLIAQKWPDQDPYQVFNALYVETRKAVLTKRITQNNTRSRPEDLTAEENELKNLPSNIGDLYTRRNK